MWTRLQATEQLDRGGEIEVVGREWGRRLTRGEYTGGICTLRLLYCRHRRVAARVLLVLLEELRSRLLLRWRAILRARLVPLTRSFSPSHHDRPHHHFRLSMAVQRRQARSLPELRSCPRTRRPRDVSCVAMGESNRTRSSFLVANLARYIWKGRRAVAVADRDREDGKPQRGLGGLRGADWLPRKRQWFVRLGPMQVTASSH